MFEFIINASLKQRLIVISVSLLLVLLRSVTVMAMLSVMAAPAVWVSTLGS